MINNTLVALIGSEVKGCEVLKAYLLCPSHITANTEGFTIKRTSLMGPTKVVFTPYQNLFPLELMQ